VKHVPRLGNARTASRVRSADMSRRISIWVLASIVAVVASACSDAGGSSDDGSDAPTSETAAAAPQPDSGAPPWPAPSDPLAKTEEAGLVAEPKEFFGIHLHAHLDIFVNGEPVEVPAGIGIDITNPDVKTGAGPSYGGIELCAQPCISPLHTHDVTGVLHTEAAENETNSLGQFFIEWDVALDENCVGGYCEPEAPISVFVDGEPYDDDPAEIGLEDQREIAIVIGSFPDEVPSTYDFSNA
jgi:hypothetical protein